MPKRKYIYYNSRREMLAFKRGLKYEQAGDLERTKTGKYKILVKT